MSAVNEETLAKYIQTSRTISRGRGQGRRTLSADGAFIWHLRVRLREADHLKRRGRGAGWSRPFATRAACEADAWAFLVEAGVVA